jgi:hypothetical protein
MPPQNQIVPNWRDLLRRISLSISWQDHPLHRHEGYRPFFIIGSGRCGMTLLRRILIANSELHIPPETYVLGRTTRLYTKFKNAAWEDLVDIVLAAFEFHPQFDTFDLSLRPLAVRLKETPPSSRSLAFILNAFYRFHASSCGSPATRWGDKTPLNAFCLGRIQSVFPDAQFIHLVRDGVDVVASMIKMGLSLETSVDRWRTALQICRRFVEVHSDVAIELQYEDLVLDPERVVRQVCDFLQTTYDEKMLHSETLASEMGDVPKLRHHENVGRPITSETVGWARRTLSPDELQQIEYLIGDRGSAVPAASPQPG